MEYLDIYDEEGNPLGKEERSEYTKKHTGVTQCIVGFTIKLEMFIFK